MMTKRLTFSRLNLRRFWVLSLSVIAVLCVSGLFFRTASAAELSYTNPDTGYQAFVLDRGDYLTKDEETSLLDNMKSITEYTNVVYLTDEGNISESESYSKNLCIDTLSDLFQSRSAVIYLVDNEYDYIYVQGAAGSKISSTQAYNITDDVYTYSAKEKYYQGALKAFGEIERLLSGKRIYSPVQYICNAFVALFVAIIVNYFLILRATGLKRASVADLVSGSVASTAIGLPSANLTHTTRVYSPRSSGGGRGGHGGGHGGGGHGGGHSH